MGFELYVQRRRELDAARRSFRPFTVRIGRLTVPTYFAARVDVVLAIAWEEVRWASLDDAFAIAWDASRHDRRLDTLERMAARYCWRPAP